MAFFVGSKVAILATLILVFTASLPVRADVTVVNQCPYTLTVFSQDQTPNSLQQFTVAAGASQALGVGTSWTGGVVWGSQHANTNNGQCTQLEFTLGAAGRDSYDISLVNAYNEAASITATSTVPGDAVGGLECGTPTCTISSSELQTVCTPDNVFAGPDNACINTDGPGLVDTPNIDRFRNACPEVYVQSNNNTNVVYGCDTGAAYSVTFCP